MRNEVERVLPFSCVLGLELDTGLIKEDTRQHYGELRFQLLGFIVGRLHAMVCTPREDKFHVIRRPKKGKSSTMSTLKTQSNTPVTPDTDNPAWSAKNFSQARPAPEVLPHIFSKARTESLLTPRGRPKADVTKVRVGIRLSQEVVDHFKASGDGWQTRIDAVLRQFIAAQTSSR